MSNEHSDQSPGQNKPVQVIINLVTHQLTGKVVSYSELAKLAYPGDSGGAEITYTITFTNPHGPDGELREGEEEKLHEGMVFVVGKSNRS